MTENQEQLKKDLKTQTRLAEDRLNQLKYLQADFDNYRKLEGEERARLAVIEEFSEDAILAKTLDGIITSWNTNAERIYGYSAQEIIGKSISLLVPPDLPDDTVLILERIGNGEQVVRYETLRRKKEGKLINIALTASPIRDAQNHIIGVSTIAHDITQRKLAEEAMHASEIRYRRLFETAQDGILILDADTGQIVEVNPYSTTMLGFSRDQFLGKKIWEIGVFKDIVANKDNFEELQRKEYIRYEDLPLETADGRNIAVEFVSNVYRVNNKKVIQCNIRDITARKLVEEALNATETRYRRLFETAQDGILILDADTGQIVEVNPFLIAMLGFSRDQFLGKKLWEIGLFKDIVANKDNFGELQRKEYIRYENMPLETADGRHIAVEFISNVYTVNNTKVIQCNIRDNTDRKLAEEALRQKNEEMDGYFTYTLDLLCIADADGHFRRLNREWESALGYSPTELEGKRFLDFVHPDDMKASLGAMAELKAGKQVLQFTNRYRHRDGSYRWIEWRLFPAGDLIYGSARDITERKMMTDLVEASLAEKETLLREIHHRVKNNLQIISSLLSLQINKISDPRTIEALKDSQTRVMSMALVHEHLYRGEDFSRIDLSDYIHALGTNLFQSYKAADERIQFEQEIPEINVDINTAIPLGLIINELITNSLKYAFKEKKDGLLSITATEDAQSLNIIVRDNGSGIPEGITLENQTSLGLRLVSRLTSQLHGTVVIDSSEGTKFVFTFAKPAEIPGKERLVNMLHGHLPGTVAIDRTEDAKFVFTVPQPAETPGKAGQ
ncbi:MAG: PAS domain S-box protein [Methanoregula sp.]|nr:PAS domain S-box protein [Methanoregula sp.]